MEDKRLRSTQCQTGEDANENLDCRMVGAAASLEEYWNNTIDGATPTEIVLFTGTVSTACGGATSSVGPFYCPPDQKIYIDTAFFDQLQQQFGSSGGPLAQLYVVGHEWGHHIQNITGLMSGLDMQTTGPTSDGVRLELQADCFAGAWVGAASTTLDDSGTPFLNPPTDAEIARRAERRGGRGRRQHPGADAGSGAARDLDARRERVAPEVVPDRVSAGRELVRHVRRERERPVGAVTQRTDFRS